MSPILTPASYTLPIFKRGNATGLIPSVTVIFTQTSPLILFASNVNPNVSVPVIEIAIWFLDSPDPKVKFPSAFD